MDTTVENKVKHTPGPWKVTEVGGSGSMAIGADSNSDKGLICTIARWRKEHEANAKLIASAPDLLEALQNWVAVRTHKIAGGNTIIDSNNKEERSLILAAINAIEKATK